MKLHASSRSATVLGSFLLAVVLLAGIPSPIGAQPAQEKELIAVLDLDRAGATPEQAGAITDRLREEVLRSGAFTLIDRSRLEALLSEQALQQTVCTTPECAVEVGRILGIRRIVAGKVTRISDKLWQFSALMVDVETAETLRAETVIHEGGFVGLLRGGVTEMGRRLSAGIASPPAPGNGMNGAFAFQLPGQAEVFLNGKAQGKGARTIADLLPGTYEIVVRHPGKRSWKQSVFLPPGRTIDVAPEFKSYRMAIFPVRRSGTWRSSITHTRGWATQALVRGLNGTGIEITRTAHVKGGPYPITVGEDLSGRDDLEDDAWSFLGDVDRGFVVNQGKALEVDLVLLFHVDAGASFGTYKAFLVDVESGEVEENSGSFSSGGAIPAVATQMRAFINGWLEGR